MVIDPVCGARLDPEKAAATFAYQGKTYYFDSEECRRKFEEAPEQYAENEEMTVQEGYGTPTSLA